MADDIRRFGSTDGWSWFWVKHDVGAMGAVGLGRGLMLVAITEIGEILETPRRAPWDPDAPTREEALVDHLAAAAAEADGQLERHKRQNPRSDEPKAAGPPLMDPATARFLGGG